MKINLVSLITSYINLDKKLFEKYITSYGIKIKGHEIDSLKVMLYMSKKYNLKIKYFDDFFVGFIIPQIGKEFDLLKINDNEILNIEIKSESDEETIESQLIKNIYYLNSLGKTVSAFTFNEKNKKFYSIDDKNKVIEISEKIFFEKLFSFESNSITDLNSLFNPSDFLISPFNSTKRFIGGEYFLNNQQNEFKKNVLKKQSEVNKSIISICGEAGTGKSLLTYDIAKEIINNKESIIVFHCGILNNGHLELINEHDWNISEIQFLNKNIWEEYKYIVIDEAQRLREGQFNILKDIYLKHNVHILFSYDYRQTLSIIEIKRNISHKIDNLSTSKFILKNKVRCNKELGSFINRMFYKNKPIENYNYESVNIIYFINNIQSVNKLKELSSNGCKIINFTPSIYDKYPYNNYNIENMETAHKVIGQEYDSVAVIIDAHFYYKNHILSSKGYSKRPYYHPTKMLYQIVSRARKNLNIIIINNTEVLERCLNIKNIQK